MRAKTIKKRISLILSTAMISCATIAQFGAMTAFALDAGGANLDGYVDKGIITMLPPRTIDLSKGDYVITNANRFTNDGAILETLRAANLVSHVFWDEIYDDSYDGEWALSNSYDLNNDGAADIVVNGYYSDSHPYIISVAPNSSSKGAISFVPPKSYIDEINENNRKYSSKYDAWLYESLTFVYSINTTTSESSEATEPTSTADTPATLNATTAPTAEEIIAQFDVAKSYTAEQAAAAAKDFIQKLKALGVSIAPEFTEQVTIANSVLGKALAEALGQKVAAETPAAPATETTANTQVAETPATPGSAYTVEKGDNLYKIAEKLLGNGKLWRKIYEANKDQIKNSKDFIIYAGQTFVIPTLQ